MPKRIGTTTKEHLFGAPLPLKTDTYTVISHEFIVNKTKEVLDRMGFTIQQELYKCNEEATIAQGVYKLKFDDSHDPEMGMMFAWANSYDKSMRFKCAIGGYLNNSGSAIISGEMGSWNRRHSGTADSETSDTIISQIENAAIYYNQLVEDKKVMKTIIVSDQQRAEIIGRIYLQYELLTSEQLSVVKEQFKKSSYDYNAPKDSLWSLYSHVIYALQKAHPRTWMDQQRMIHLFLTEEFKIKSNFVTQVAEVEVSEENTEELPGTDPNQITIEQVIEEEEAKVAAPVEESTVIENNILNEVNAIHHGMPAVEHHVIEEEEVILAPEVITLEDNTWPCLKCGKEQPSTAVFNDGQLCTSCFNENN